MTVTSDNIGTDISLSRVGRTRLTERLGEVGLAEIRSNVSTGELARIFFVLADQFATLTDREIFERGVPPVSEEERLRITEGIAREPEYWLGRSTARQCGYCFTS